MKKDIVAFKGVKDGLYLEIQGSNIESIKEELSTKIIKSPGFFQGTRFLGIKSEDLSKKEIIEIMLILKYKYDFDIKFEKDDLLKLIESEDINTFDEIEDLDDEPKVDLSSEGMTKFLYGTLRSGQVVDYNGNIVVVGDVNPGALLKATGNIIVLGTLKGVAYAGIDGNNKAIVAAYNLLPTQLRIGNIIVRAPDEETSQYKFPEVAKIIYDKIVIEPYLPNKL